MKIHPIQRPFLLHGPLCSLSLSLFWTLSRFALLCSPVLLLLFLSLSLSSVIRLSFSLTFGGHKLKHPTVPGGQYQGTRPICRSIISLCNHSMHHEQLQLATVCVWVCVAALTLFQNQNCLKITINQELNIGILCEHLHLIQLFKKIQIELIKQAAKRLK